MPKTFTSKHQKIGELGEKVAVQFLMKHGFRILERNYTRPWGEIDIVAMKKGKIHFIEVKSVTHETEYNPEDNMHLWKRKRLARTIQTYLISDDTDWQVDLLVIFLDIKSGKARIKVIKDIVL